MENNTDQSGDPTPQPVTPEVAPTQSEPFRTIVNIPELKENLRTIDHQFLEEIGFGSFGRVFKIHNLKTNKDFAAKVYVPTQLSQLIRKSLEETQKLVNLEVDLMKKLLVVDEVVRYKKHHIFPDMIVIIMELCENKSLEELIRTTNNNNGLDTNTIIRILKQLASGIHEIHLNEILHRDLKPSNILIDSNFNIKICDFGFAYQLFDHKTTVTSTTAKPGAFRYFSPEIIGADCKSQSYKSDIWCIGVILVDMICGYSKVSENDLRCQFNDRIIDQNIPDDKKIFADIVKGCLNLNDARRFDGKQLNDAASKLQSAPANAPVSGINSSVSGGKPRDPFVFIEFRDDCGNTIVDERMYSYRKDDGSFLFTARKIS